MATVLRTTSLIGWPPRSARPIEKRTSRSRSRRQPSSCSPRCRSRHHGRKSRHASIHLMRHEACCQDDRAISSIYGTPLLVEIVISSSITRVPRSISAVRAQGSGMATGSFPGSCRTELSSPDLQHAGRSSRPVHPRPLADRRPGRIHRRPTVGIRTEGIGVRRVVVQSAALCSLRGPDRS